MVVRNGMLPVLDAVAILSHIENLLGTKEYSGRAHPRGNRYIAIYQFAEGRLDR